MPAADGNTISRVSDIASCLQQRAGAIGRAASCAADIDDFLCGRAGGH